MKQTQVPKRRDCENRLKAATMTMLKSELFPESLIQDFADGLKCNLDLTESCYRAIHWGYQILKQTLVGAGQPNCLMHILRSLCGYTQFLKKGTDRSKIQLYTSRLSKSGA